MHRGSLVSLRATALAFLAPLVIAGCSSADPTQTPSSDNGSTSTAHPAPGGGSNGAAGGGGTSGGSTPGAPGDDAGAGSGGGPGGGSDGGASSPDGGGTGAPGSLTSLQRHKAEMLTSIWENSTTVLQYPYVQNIGDGRGYTCGRAGFCTGTGDAIQVVQCFDAATKNANPLHKYMPALTTINDKFNSTGQDQGDTSLLDKVGSFITDWASSASDAATSAAFHACQDQIVDLLYFNPGLDQAKKWGLTTALTKAALYDAEINHGDDGVTVFVNQANSDTGNGAQKPPSAPLTVAQESTWLQAFLSRRLKALGADSTWKDSVDRAALYEKLRLASNWDLSGPIVTDAKAFKMFPSGGYKDSGYPACDIDAAGAVSGDAQCTSPTGL